MNNLTFQFPPSGTTGSGQQGALDVVKWFGVVQDSSTDNTIAMTNAIASGRDLYIPGSDDMIYLAGPMPAFAEGQTIVGADRRASILRWTGTGYDALTFQGSETTQKFGGGLRNLGLRHSSGGGEMTSNAAIRIDKHNRLLFENLELNEWYKNFHIQYTNFLRISSVNFFAPNRLTMMHSLVHVEGSDFAQTTNLKFYDLDGKGDASLDPFVDKAFYVQDVDYALFEGCHVNLSNNPVWIDDRAGADQINDVYFDNCYFDENHNGVDVRGNPTQLYRDIGFHRCYFRKTLNGAALSIAPTGGIVGCYVTNNVFAFNDTGSIAAGGAAAVNLTNLEIRDNFFHANNRNYDVNGNVGAPAAGITEVSVGTRNARIEGNNFGSVDFSNAGVGLSINSNADGNISVADNEFRGGDYATKISNTSPVATSFVFANNNWDGNHGEEHFVTSGLVTPTLVTVWSRTLLEQEVIQVIAEVVAMPTTNAAGNSYVVHACFYRDGGGATTQGGTTNDIAVAESATTMAVTFDVSGNDIRLRITPANAGTWTALTTVRWHKALVT